jgi:hypothetical protein
MDGNCANCSMVGTRMVAGGATVCAKAWPANKHESATQIPTPPNDEAKFFTIIS